jgi:hypothetical protein
MGVLQTAPLHETEALMTGEEFMEFHKAACEKMHAICKAKNADYAGQKGGADAFANFRMVELYGVASVEQGLFTRMSDKFARIATFLQRGDLEVKDESVQDTLLDFANYCLLTAAYLSSKRKEAGVIG